MVGEKVVLRYRMSARDAHYASQLVEGARIVTAWGNVAAELAIRLFGDEALFLGYFEIHYATPVYSGDWMEYSGWIEKVGNTSLTCYFEARKVIELADRDGNKGLADSAANVLPEPFLCAYGAGAIMVKKELQRPEFADPKFQMR